MSGTGLSRGTTPEPPHIGTEHEHQEHNPTSQDPKTGIAGAASTAASKTVSFMTAKLSTKTSRIAAAAAAGTLVLAGGGTAYAVHANDVSNHNKQVAAAQFAAAQKAAADKAAADAAAQAAADKAAAEKAAADAAAKAAADKAAADAAAKAAADKAAADRAAAARAAAAAAANRDQQRQPLPTATPTQTSSPSPSPSPTSTPTSPSTPKPTTPSGSYGSAYDIAKSMVPASQFACFSNVVERESGWDVHATNPSSGAYGLGQALPGSKMASAGSDWENNPATQIKWVLSYMDSRYGSPCGAWSFWQSHSWY